MFFSRLTLLTVMVVAALVVYEAVGLPTPGKADAAKIQKNMAKNKGIRIRYNIMIPVFCRFA